MAGKYAHVIDKLPRLLNTEPKYQEKVEVVKKEMLRHPCDCGMTDEADPEKHAGDCAYQHVRTFVPATDLTKVYIAIRNEIDGLEAKLSDANLRLEANSQLMTNQFEVEDLSSLSINGVGSVRAQYEPYAKVDDKEKFRLWCVTPLGVCMTCGGSHDAIGHNPETFTHKYLPGGGLEKSLALPWQSTNSIVKERLLSGEPEPPGVIAHAKVKIVLTREK